MQLLNWKDSLEVEKLNFDALSEEIAQFTVHHHLRQICVYRNNQSLKGAVVVTLVIPQSAAKTTRIILDRYLYGPVSQFLLRVWTLPG